MAITVYKQKTMNKNFEKKIQKICEKQLFFWFFSSKSWNGEEFTKLRPETESRNSGDYELWNHEMRGSPVYGDWFMTFGLSKDKVPFFTYFWPIFDENFHIKTIRPWWTSFLYESL